MKGLNGLMLLVICGLCVFSVNTVASKGKTPPNIILIMADDVSPDKFGVYGQAGAVKTPNIDALGRQGVTFKTAYATAMCGPSRVQIMTGRYATNTGVYQNGIWTGTSRKDVYSKHHNFVQAVKQAGYKTAITGKWHAGDQLPTDTVIGFDEYSLWTGDHEAERLGAKEKFTGAFEDHKTPSRYWQPSFTQNGTRLKTKKTDFGVDVETDFVIDFITRHKQQPFLVYWPTVAPHGTRKGMPTTPFRGTVGEMGKTKREETAARFDALIEYLDYSVGRVMKTLEEQGLADNTIIIFTSDNGTAVTAKTRGIERGVQVVSVMSGPAIKSRGLTDELMDFTNIAPTIAELATGNKSQSSKFDGDSLVDFLTAKTEQTRPWIFGYISGSQIFRTKNYMLEALNPMMEVPDGRLYATGEHRFQKGYQRLRPTDDGYAKGMDLMAPLRALFLPLQRNHPYFSTPKGKRFMKEYLTESSRKKHLFNHKDYQNYDDSL